MPNRLANETSPYLLQHAQNPVDWYPWGEEALARAKAENKPMLISVGYAACHWCHVMEHESFEDEEVAALMNEHFICIKVDREERPDVDKVYMDAVQLMTGRGGWPLNCIALPDGKPVYGGTYFRKDQWMEALNQVSTLWTTRPETASEYADNLVEAMQKLSVEISEGSKAFTPEDLYEMRGTWMEQIDFKWGGRDASANKFPLPQNLIMLTRAGHLLKDESMLSAAEITLEKIAYGGIYDHLGGGFARYSVDAFWKVPHFEKMLYDNSQLVSAYSEAWRRTGRERYKNVVTETLGFIQRELTSPEGACYSSLDADSEGVEGKFYTWSFDEIGQLLGEDAKMFCDYYNVHPFGNWEETNVLFVLEEESEFAQRWNLDVAGFRSILAKGRTKLLEARAARVRPGLDDKVLCSWNALMIQGYVDAYLAFGDNSYLEAGRTIAEFIDRKMLIEGQLFRNYKNNKATIPAFLDDYAYLIKAYISLYQATFETSWLTKAGSLLESVQEQFYDKATGLYFFTSSAGEQLVNRKMETQDDVIPSSNAVMSLNLFMLGTLIGNHELKERSRAMILSLKNDVMAHPAWHSVWGQRMLLDLFAVSEVVFTGEQAIQNAEHFREEYFPGVIYAGGDDESIPLLQGRVNGESLIYVCEDSQCQLPVKKVQEAWKLVSG